MPRVTPDLFAAVIKKFLTSQKFEKLAAETQRSYRRALLVAERPDILGSLPVDVLRPSHVQAMLDGLADRPGLQTTTQTALKALEKWAIVRDLLPQFITTGTEVVEHDGGHIPWSDDQVAFAERSASRPLANAVTLAANTGQRGSDLVKMLWTDIETIRGFVGINVIQRKTKRKIWVPFTAELVTKMADWDRGTSFILRKADGMPFENRAQLTDAWVRERRNNPAMERLRDLHLHGLRGTACVRLRRAGATSLQISSMVGLSAAMVERYCRFSVQTENALAAVEKLDAHYPQAKVLEFKKT